MGLMLCSCMVFMCACAKADTAEKLQQEDAPAQISVTIGPESYDSADTPILIEKNEEKKTMTFFNIDVGKKYTLDYDGTTCFYDKYGKPLTLSQIMIGDIVDDPVAQLLLAVVIDRAVGEVVEQAGQDHVQVGDAQGQVVLHGQAAQPADGEAEIHTGLGRGQERAFRLEAVEGARVFRNDVRREDGGDSVDVLTHFVIAVGHQGKNNGRVPGIEPVGRFVNGHDGGAPGDHHQLCHGMDVGGEGMVGHLTDKHLFRALLIESTHSLETSVFCCILCPACGTLYGMF